MLNKSEITRFTVHVNHLSIVKEWRFYLLHTLNHYVGITTEMFRTGISATGKLTVCCPGFLSVLGFTLKLSWGTIN